MFRAEPELTARYAKDKNAEMFLHQLNTHLALIEPTEELPERYPTLHIIGAPRSGTTLLSQMIASSFNLGYINNLIAAFWQAPTVGIRLSKKLLGVEFKSNYTSTFGRTSSIYEPHEFGYFWEYLLRYGDLKQKNQDFEEQIDWNTLSTTIINMTYAFERPIVFKSFLLGFHIKRIQQTLPMSCFINIVRDPIQNALSLLKYRREVLESENKCGSIIPLEYDTLVNEPYWMQVVGQIYYLEQAFQRQIQEVGGHNIITIKYESLCEDPYGTFEIIKNLLSQYWNDVKFQLSETSFIPSTKMPSTIEEQMDYDNIQTAVQRFYHGEQK